METRIDEIADHIYRMSTFASSAGPNGITFCEFVIDADEALLFHCGHHQRFHMGAAALTRVMPPDRLRWIGYSHVEADEAGAVNDWLAAAPRATAFHGRIGCNIWLNDTAIRQPRALRDGDTLDIGGKRVRFIATPHLPHCWDAGLIYEESTGTLFCSDLLAQPGDAALFAGGDILSPAIAFEAQAHATSLTADTGNMIRRLAELSPRRLALMHGPVYTGDAAAALNALADYFDARLRRAL